MTTNQIQTIVATAAFPGRSGPVEWVETHISWVILTPDYAFKIKKPLILGFLDFSTLEKRKFYCEEEVRLNRRLAPDMYLGVLPIRAAGDEPAIGATTGQVLDYAVHMRRIDNRFQMDRLLADNQVTPDHMQQLAAVLGPFHREATMTGAIVYHPGAHWADFAELYRLGADIKKHLGEPAVDKMEHWRTVLPAFLERHAGRLQERVRESFWVDGHGDLHTRNIFLPAGKPLIFDCIEFSPHFRQSDILNELAFLCMDLDARKHPELAKVFLTAYTAYRNVFPKPEDMQLFRFFKAYRANVRLKVALLELQQHRTLELGEQVRLYWGLMEGYVAGI